MQFLAKIICFTLLPDLLLDFGELTSKTQVRPPDAASAVYAILGWGLGAWPALCKASCSSARVVKG